ncbi:unnamed protein product, partial [Pylaiella littoralis]
MTSGNGFPYILHDLLKSEAANIVTWTSTGTAFGILDNAAFGQDVLSSYFKHNKFSSFQRQLNLYGFRKIVKGRESGCYMHPSFQRDRPDLLSEVKRGVVPPCPASYTRKVYGSGPRFMNQDDDSDSEPELLIPSRGTRDKSPDPGQLAGPLQDPGALRRIGDMHHPQYPRGPGAPPPPPQQQQQQQQHQGVLSGARGGYDGLHHAGAVGLEDGSWRSRPPNSMHGAGGAGRGGGVGGGGGGGGGDYYRGLESVGVPGGMLGAQAYSHQQQLQMQLQQQQQQQQQQHHLQQQQQQRYLMQQQQHPPLHQQAGRYSGGAAAAAAGGVTPT